MKIYLSPPCILFNYMPSMIIIPQKLNPFFVFICIKLFFLTSEKTPWSWNWVITNLIVHSLYQWQIKVVTYIKRNNISLSWQFTYEKNTTRKFTIPHSSIFNSINSFHDHQYLSEKKKKKKPFWSFINIYKDNIKIIYRYDYN